MIHARKHAVILLQIAATASRRALPPMAAASRRALPPIAAASPRCCSQPAGPPTYRCGQPVGHALQQATPSWAPGAVSSPASSHFLRISDKQGALRHLRQASKQILCISPSSPRGQLLCPRLQHICSNKLFNYIGIHGNKHSGPQLCPSRTIGW